MSDVIARIEKGKWKGKRLELKIGPIGANSAIMLDGKDISNLVLSAHIDIEPDDYSKLRLKIMELPEEVK